MICETKIVDFFPNSHFQIKDFNTLFRLDRVKNNGDIMIFIRENIPTKLLLMDKSMESFYIEINLRSAKCFFVKLLL